MRIISKNHGKRKTPDNECCASRTCSSRGSQGKENEKEKEKEIEKAMQGGREGGRDAGGGRE